MNESQQGNTENAPARMRQDEQAVQDLDACITEFECDPFNLDDPRLRSLQSGVVASDELIKDFESAHKDGEDLFKSFCNERIFSARKSFFATIPRNSRRNFSNPPPTKSNYSLHVSKSEAMENKAMASVVALAEADKENFNLSDVMEYRLTDECLSIFNINGTMRKVQKCKLVEQLNLETVEPYPCNYIALLDMGFLWRLCTPSPEERTKSDGTLFTWRDYASKMFSLVNRRHPNAKIFAMVNDPYDLPYTIKDSERLMRWNLSSTMQGPNNVFMKAQDKFPAPESFQELLQNKANKQRLQIFLKNEFSQLCQGGQREFIYSVGLNCWNLGSGTKVTEYECSHIEADTILLFVYSNVHRSGIAAPVIIDSEDTDVMVLAANVAHRFNGILGIKRKDRLIDCKKLCSPEIAEIVLPMHVHSGSDTTAGFFGHGKKTIFDKTLNSPEARSLLKSLGQVLPVTQDVLDNMMIYTIKYVYNDKRSKSLGEARANKWKSMKRKSTVRIPPDRDSHDLKVKRANYQTYMLLNIDKKDPVPSPLSHGWVLENGLCKPVRYTKPALPRNLQNKELPVPEETSHDSDSESNSDDNDDDNEEMYDC